MARLETIPRPRESLLVLPIREASTAQLQLITKDSIHPGKRSEFNPFIALGQLQRREGVRTAVADMGGDSVERAIVVMRGGYPSQESNHNKLKSRNGAGYVGELEVAAGIARRDHLAVGVSYGGPLEGTSPLFHPKLVEFYNDLQERHSGDLATLFNGSPVLRIENDAEAGIKAGATLAAKVFGNTFDNVMYIINGGGLGAAVLKKEGNKYLINPTEVGHVEVVPELNPYGQTDVCGVFDNSAPCLEGVVASGKGVEDLYAKITGISRPGTEISPLYQSGDRLATGLYESSANALAHAVTGLMDVYKLDPARTVVAYQGGIFGTPDYGLRVQQLVGQYVKGPSMRSLFLPDITTNASLDGAAISATLA